MAIVYSNEAEVYNLEYLRSVWNAGGGVNIHLFVNDITPGAATVVGDFTEAGFKGYATVNRGDFSVPATVSNRAQTACTPAAFNYDAAAGGNASEIAYGWYATHSTGGLQLMAERFASPVTFSANGHTKTVSPVLTLFSEN